MSTPGANPVDDLGRLFQEALRCHQAGQLDAAEARYQRILVQQRNHVDTLHLLAVCLHQRRDFAGAEKHLRTALKLRPDLGQLHLSHGNTLREMGRLDAAIESYVRATKLAPGLDIAHYNLGTALEEQGRMASALESYDRAVALRPDAKAIAGRANCLVALGRLDEAIAAYRAATALDPGHVDAHANLAASLAAQRQFVPALTEADLALALQPAHAGASVTRALILNELQRPGDALDATGQLAADSATRHDALFQRAWSLARLQRMDEARELLERLLAQDPQHWYARFELAAILAHLRRPDEAIAQYDRLLQVRPDDPRAFYNRGLVQYTLGNFASARAAFEDVLARDPRFPLAAFQLGMIDLLEGNYTDGWRRHEDRWDVPLNRAHQRPFTQAAWLGGADIDGQTLLVHAEQGLGDTLQFVRYLPALAKRCGRLVFECPPPLAGLLRRSLPASVEVLAFGSALPAFDRHCPLLSVPLAVGTTVDSIPADCPYLVPDPVRVALWRDRLGACGGACIGLAWSGNPHHDNDRHRSIALEAWSGLMRRIAERSPRPVRFVSLQNHLRPGDRDALAAEPALHYFGEAIGDFDDTAALASLCDLVICVDTAAAHLAGALGMPTWVLLPYVPDWRWMLQRADSPWYPTMRLFRQAEMANWVPVLEVVEGALGNFLGAAGGAPRIADPVPGSAAAAELP